MSRNSSTSSSEPDWRRYVGLMLASAAAAAGVLYLLILIVDPYDSVHFSPAWDRYPARGDHRHWNARLLRRPEFDSLVIGTSTAMLLKPPELNAAFGGHFVNLAMPLSTAHEQLRILALFHHYHPALAAVIVDLDFLWCHGKPMPEHGNDILARSYPDWLYDTNPWNDLPPFNKTSLKAAYDQTRAMLGLHRPYARWLDGYEDITRTLHRQNDPAAIRRRLRESHRETLNRDYATPLAATRYPALEQLEASLSALPAGSLKIILFPPIHADYQPRPGTEQAALWDGCKARAAAMTERLPRLTVVDFLIPSPITRDDDHYIDGYHYTTAVASRVTELLKQAIETPTVANDAFRRLGQSPAGNARQ